MRIRIQKNLKAFPRLRNQTDALTIDAKDLNGPILREFGTEHRKQENRIFATEGGEGGAGKWADLNPDYKARKAGRRRTLRKGTGSIRRFAKRTGQSISVIGISNKILQLTGDMKSRFTKRNNPSYVQRFRIERKGKGVFEFGASSAVAAAHFRGKASLAAGKQSSQARKVFGGVAPQLPVRDMVTKSREQIQAFQKRLKNWYINKRVPQVAKRFKGKGNI